MEELARYEGGGNIVNFEEYAMSVDHVVRQIELVQEVQRKVMRSGEHYGTIPGCGDKPTLLKPGAEKLGFTFRLAPEFEVTPIDWSGGHREYQVRCRLRHIPTGTMVGEGVGTCTTLEGKFRFRWDNTGKPVPKQYWDTKDKDLIGGPFNVTRKIDGQWYIFQRVEHDNPADYYNTCEKMAKKRAHVDAILTATAASDIFTQDIEDMPETVGRQAPPKADDPHKNERPPVKEPVRASGADATKTVDDLRRDMAAMLLEMEGSEAGASAKLKELSGFEGKDGRVEGKADVAALSDKAVAPNYGKVKKLYEAWKGQTNG